MINTISNLALMALSVITIVALCATGVYLIWDLWRNPHE